MWIAVPRLQTPTYKRTRSHQIPDFATFGQAPSSSTSSCCTQVLPSLEDVDRLSVKELKALLQRHEVRHQDCLEKADLQRKVRLLVTQKAAEKSLLEGSAAARSSVKGGYTSQEAAAADASSSSAPPPVAPTAPDQSARTSKLPGDSRLRKRVTKKLHFNRFSC